MEIISRNTFHPISDAEHTSGLVKIHPLDYVVSSPDPKADQETFEVLETQVSNGKTAVLARDMNGDSRVFSLSQIGAVICPGGPGHENQSSMMLLSSSAVAMITLPSTVKK